MGASSNVVTPSKGCTIEGKHGVYVLGKILGQGGNGTVFDAQIKNKKDSLLHNEYGVVIKVLTLSKIKNAEEKKKRRERFQREIKVVRKVSDSSLAIVPIIDSYMDVHNYSCEWYVMPKAKECKYAVSYNPLENIKQLRDVGVTLLKLHKMGVFHRDIKPANILYYNNQYCLTDFGLVWNNDNCNHITGTNEAVGPVGIRPPEMEYHDEKLNIEIDYQKVDVYLYVKTIWIFLTGNRNGFRGEYNRADRMVYLNREQLNLGRTIEPLHKMLEKATQHINTDRITIKECIDYIDQQIAIAEERLPEKTILSLIYDEKISEAKNQIDSDLTCFKTTEKIHIALSKLVNTVEVVVEEYGESISLGVLCSVKKFRTDMFMLSIKSGISLDGRKKRNLIVRITQLSIDNDNLSEITTDELTDFGGEISRIKKINDYIRNEDTDIGLDSKYHLTLRKMVF